VDDEWLLDDRAHAHPRIERFGGILEDHLEIAAQRPELALGEVGDVGASELDGSGSRLEQADDGLAEGGFAAAGFTDEAEGFAGSDVESRRPPRAPRRSGAASRRCAPGSGRGAGKR
jgi:hypothetical protein